MTPHWRGHPDEQTPMQRFYRERWPYGSLLVLDIDRVVCSRDGRHGFLCEEKHRSAQDRTCRITRSIAARLGWWSGLLVYETTTGSPFTGEVLMDQIDLTIWSPQGTEYRIPEMQIDTFDHWVMSEFGEAVYA